MLDAMAPDAARPGELVRGSSRAWLDVGEGRHLFHEQVRVALGERMNACMRRWHLFCAQDRRVWFATAWAV